MKKRICASLLAVALVISLFAGITASAKGEVFSDVPMDSWGAEYVYDLVERGIVSGYGDGTFGPRNSVQRCEYAKMLVNLTGTEIVNKAVSPYVDVPSWEWYFPYVNSSTGFMVGYTVDGTLYFRPEQDATREEIIVALVKALNLSVDSCEDPTAYLSERFVDVDTVSEHNRKYIAAAVDHGFITGNENGTLCGQDPIIRLEIVAILYRAFPPKQA